MAEKRREARKQEAQGFNDRETHLQTGMLGNRWKNKNGAEGLTGRRAAP